MNTLDQLIESSERVRYEFLLAEAAKAKHGGYGQFGRRNWRVLFDEALEIKSRLDRTGAFTTT